MQDGFIPISRDSIIEMLFCGQYEFYDKHQPTLISSIENNIIHDCILFNRNIVIDETLITKKIRKERISLIQYECLYNNKEYYITLYNFGKGTEKFNLKNRRIHHKNIPINTWKSIFNIMNENYQEPELNEGFNKIITIDSSKFNYYDKYIENKEFIYSEFEYLKKLWNESIYNIITIYINSKLYSIDEINILKNNLIMNNIKYDFFKII